MLDLPEGGFGKKERRRKMEKALKSIYEEPKLEITKIIATDVITTSSVVGDVGSDGNVDDGGWTTGTNW